MNLSGDLNMRHRGQGCYELFSLWYYSGTDICQCSCFGAKPMIITAEGPVSSGGCFSNNEFPDLFCGDNKNSNFCLRMWNKLNYK